jgi:hypothetical protein
VDVPGSNCTKKLISERVAGLSPEPGPDRPSQLPTGHHQKPFLEFFGLRNFFQLFFFRSFSPFLAVFARPSAAYSFTIRRRDLEKFFNFSDLENFSIFIFDNLFPI